MPYLITNDKNYVSIQEDNRVQRLPDRSLATLFATDKEALAMKRRCCKKLKHYKIVKIKDESIKKKTIEEKTKRRCFSEKERNDIYAKSEGRCALCGKFTRFDEFTIDHILPISRNGSNDLDNLQCTCKQCNGIKQNLTEPELMAVLVQIVTHQCTKKEYKKYKKKLQKALKKGQK